MNIRFSAPTVLTYRPTLPFTLFANLDIAFVSTPLPVNTGIIIINYFLPNGGDRLASEYAAL